jgi:aldose 1-epimerase
VLRSRFLALPLVLFVYASFCYSMTNVKKEEFGKMPDGRPVEIFSLKDGAIEARITTYGARLVSLLAPDRQGKTADIVLGFESADGYLKDTSSFGAIVGRYAGRIANGTFTLDGHAYQLPKNDGNNTLHGGPENFGKQLWTGKEIPNGVELTYVSQDGEAGFPGTLTTTVRYTLSGHDLKIEYNATTDKNTVLNLTNHTYWNLAGEGTGEILKQQVKINAAQVVPVNAGLIPTGQVDPVAGTPFDFRKLTPIGKNIDTTNDQLKYGIGYDISYVLDNSGKFVYAAEAYDPASGRGLEVLTDQPAMHFYTGNHMDGAIGKGGHKYAFRNAYCFEAQHYPDSPNEPKFPTTELKPGEKFHSVTVYRFTTH